MKFLGTVPAIAIALGIVLFFGVIRHSKANPSQSELSAPTLASISQAWVQAFDFFESENDAESLNLLIEKILRERPTDLVLIGKIVDFDLKNHNRQALQALFRGLAEKEECLQVSQPTSEKAQLCEQLKKLWVNNLDSVLFFEETAGKLEKIRRALSSKECPAALPLIVDVEYREGSFVTLTDLTAQIQQCVGNQARFAQAEERLETLKIFH